MLNDRRKSSIFGLIFLIFSKIFFRYFSLSLFLRILMKYRIHQAVCKGDLVEVQRALKEYDAHRWINAACPTKDYFCPLHLACEKQDKAIVQILLKNGADVHQKLPVEACAGSKSPSDLEALDDLYAPIHFAVDYSSGGDSSLLEMLLKHGADVNHPLLDGTTPLHIAIQANDKRMIPTVEYLLKKGANINCRHGTGFTTALEDSYRCGFTEITDILSKMCQYCGTKQTKKYDNNDDNEALPPS